MAWNIWNECNRCFKGKSPSWEGVVSQIWHRPSLEHGIELFLSVFLCLEWCCQEVKGILGGLLVLHLPFSVPDGLLQLDFDGRASIRHGRHLFGGFNGQGGSPILVCLTWLVCKWKSIKLNLWLFCQLDRTFPTIQKKKIGHFPPTSRGWLSLYHLLDQRQLPSPLETTGLGWGNSCLSTPSYFSACPLEVQMGVYDSLPFLWANVVRAFYWCLLCLVLIHWFFFYHYDSFRLCIGTRQGVGNLA